MKRIVASLCLAVALFAGSSTPQAVSAGWTQVELGNGGWSDPSLGTWDPVTRTAALEVDLVDREIDIVADGVTLDGNGHTLRATNPSTVGILCGDSRTVFRYSHGF